MGRACAFFLAVAIAWSAENPYRSPEDLAKGKRLYQGHCSPCHGPEGGGGRGANIARPNLRRAADDQALFQLLREGVPGTEMPGAWPMIDREVWQTVAYVRTLGRAASEAVPGDPKRGAAIYAAKGGCAQCHSLHGSGGSMGPVLDEIGAARNAAFLRAALLDPEAQLPPDFLMLRATPRRGAPLSGVRLNEDTYTVQFRDMAGKLQSFRKEDLANLEKQTGKSPMPSYRATLTPTELDDLVAYLASLRGSK